MAESGLKKNESLKSELEKELRGKMLWIYLKVPNPIRENVIGFVDKLPEEFNLHDYIDYNLQFNKTFLSVLGPIFEKIGWNVGSDTDLNDFFF